MFGCVFVAVFAPGNQNAVQSVESTGPGFFDEELPSHETLLRYTPPTISRIYSNEGRIVDEFARERQRREKTTEEGQNKADHLITPIDTLAL